MSVVEEIKVPDIGDFDSVEIIEILVSVGDHLNVDDALITLESDKASMDVPTSKSGTVKELKVAVGDKVSEGSVVLLLEVADKAQVAATESSPSVKSQAEKSAAPSDAGGGYGGSNIIDIQVPDIGDFDQVEVIELLVAVGDKIAAEDALITLESDKASMDIPSPSSGVIKTIKITVGDKVSKGDLILTLESSDGSAQTVTSQPTKSEPVASYEGNADVHADVVVLGSGPGGYTAAFRAADLGLSTILIEKYSTLGGVCLNVGCIPSKALLHAAKVIDEAQDFKSHGITFAKPKLDIDKLRDWKSSIIKQLTGGLGGLAKQRKVKVVTGKGEFIDSHNLNVTDADGNTTVVGFKQCIIAAGSEPVNLPFIPHDDPRVIDSTGALQLEDIPKKLLVIGGGIIGLEMATVYHALGSNVSVVEMLDSLVAGADKDIVKPLHNRLKKRYENIMLDTRVTAVSAQKTGLKVTFEGKNAPDSAQVFDKILVSVGRIPNGNTIAADKAGINVDNRGFISVDKQQRTSVNNIFAIGDIVGQPMLAHKAVHEGKVAAEVCAGMNVEFAAKVIPSVAYTDPEIAWVGLTETQAKEQGLKVGKGVFPWAASGRSLSLGRNEGITKLLFDEKTDRLLGGGIVGPNAGDLIAEVALAIETNCDAADISLTIHPHPTLSETVAMAAEAFEGTITDLYMPKKK